MNGRFGAFGKIPSVGDFFRLSPPAGFVSVWDGWVQRAMLSAGAVLGAGWDSHYMSAPIWRFSLSPGLAGAQPVIGVLMPSVDRVGRRFPLTLMAVAGQGACDHFAEDTLFQRLEDVALSALDDDMTRERLDAELADIAPAEPRDCPPLRRHGPTLAMIGCRGASSVAPNLAAALLTSNMPNVSLWSAIVQEVPRLMVCEGLPDGAEMHALFDLDAPVWGGTR